MTTKAKLLEGVFFRVNQIKCCLRFRKVPAKLSVLDLLMIEKSRSLLLLKNLFFFILITFISQRRGRGLEF